MVQVTVKQSKFLSVANLDVPSNTKLNKVANALIYFATALMGAVDVLLPSFPKFTTWFNFSLSAIVVLAKILVKFTAEPTTVDIPVTDVKPVK